MTTGFDDKLDKVLARHREIGELLAQADARPQAERIRLAKEYSDLTELAEVVSTLREAEREKADLEALAQDPTGDAEMRAMANTELQAVKERIPALAQRVKVLLLPKDAADALDAILEVRAGTGGEEAALFAANLFRMYQRYAERRRWTFEILSLSETGIGGYKEAIASISGRDVFARLKYESGVHRVQRVPATEASGRIHTSAATVAVLPEAEEVDIKIEEKDLRIDTYRAQGAGGQHVNKTESAVRITHLPTGLAVACQDEKSQHKNKARAMKILRARLYEAERERIDSERADSRRSQVGSGDRSQRIRTYNFPQGRITDHRIGLTVHKLDRALDGEIDDIIDSLTAEDEASRIAALT